MKLRMTGGRIYVALRGVALAGWLVLFLAAPGVAQSVTNSWTGASDKTNWFNNGNWSQGHWPDPGEVAVISNAYTGVLVLLTNSTAPLNSLTITNATLVFSNLSTVLTATNITIRNGGKLTHTVQSATTTNASGQWISDSRVYLLCSNLMIEAGGRIAANSNGFQFTAGLNGVGRGPGGGVGGASYGYEGGGGYGGRGGGATGGGTTYGSATQPSESGSAGYSYPAGGNGGGAIRIEANGLVTVNGEITAIGGDAGAGSGGAVGGGGSGGSIYLACNAIAGTGRINADGGDSRANASWRPSGGGGGRIALLYDPVAQNAQSPALYISAAAGGCLEPSPAAPVYGYPGTIYMTNNALLSTNLGGGQLVIPGWTNWDVGNLYLTNGTVVFPKGFSLHVLTDVVARADGSLEFSNQNVLVDGKWTQTTTKQGVLLTIYGGAQSRTAIGGDMSLNGDIRFKFNAMTNEGMALDIGGGLLLTNTAEMRVYSAPRYAAGSDYGALVSVNGNFTMATGSWVYAYCYGSTGTGVLFRLGSLKIMTNGGFNAVGLGFPGGVNSAGVGPGGGSSSGGGGDVGGAGGGYGGRGGNGKLSGALGGPTYGSSNAPILAGSGGGTYVGGGNGGPGGGVIRIDASNGSVRVDGVVSVDGGAGGTYGGGGSGGSIYLICRTLVGGGLLSAGGGPRGLVNAGGGGGGRIAVLTTSHPLDAVLPTMQALGNTNSYGVASNGTVVLIVDPNAPRITNGVATSITVSTVDLVGNLTSTGGAATTVSVYWGRTNGLAVKGNWESNATIGVRSPGGVTNSISSLAGATLYYFCFYATNAQGEDWALPSAFFTTAGPPDVNNSGGATNITLTSATLRGYAQGTPFPTVTIHWGIANGGTNALGWSNHIDMGVIANATFVSSINGLLANQTYYYRCYATNDNGYAWASSTTNFFTGVPILSIADAQVIKGVSGTSTDAVFAVTLSATSAVDVTVGYSTSNGTAAAGTEFYGTNGTLTIPSGSAGGFITAVVIGNDVDQFPSRNFYINLSNPTNASFGDPQGLCTIVDTDRFAQVRYWSGIGDWWGNPTNWTPNGIPGPMDTVIIPAGTSFLSAAATVTSLIVSNGGTLLFTNWSTSLRSTSVMVGSSGIVTHAAQSATTTNASGQWIPDSRMYFICSNLTIDAGGVISASSKGFAYGVSGSRGCGLGGGYAYEGGGGYGGVGGGTKGGPTYGSFTAPAEPGSGGSQYLGSLGGYGGGVILIEASGVITVNGEISAIGGNGTPLSGGVAGGGGSGGSVYLSSSVLRGSGRITADGGDARANNSASYPPSGGGGGRIALLYDPAAQSGETVTPYICAAGGACSEVSTVAPVYGYPGTVYMTNTALLSTNLGGGQLIIPGWTDWTVGNLILTNGMVVFPTGFSLRVLADVTAQADGWLALSNMNIHVDGKWTQNTTKQGFFTTIYGGPQSRTVIGGDLILDGGYTRFAVNALTNEGMVLNVGGGLMLTNTAEMHVYSASRYAADSDYGVLVSVTGQFVVATGSWVYAYCYGFTGTGALFRVGSLIVMTNGGFNTDVLGYPSLASSAGFGPGGGSVSGGDPDTGGGGGGYGGRGGAGKKAGSLGGPTYGNSYAPILAGSSGGTYGSGGGAPGGAGGGVIRIDAGNGDMRVDGTLTANGGTGLASYGAGGSGGAIYLICRTLTGGGLLSANGGGRATVAAGGGGGGRIAVWCGLSDSQKARAKTGDLTRLVLTTNYAKFLGRLSVINGIGYTNQPPGGAESGTILFINPKQAGTIITFM